MKLQLEVCIIVLKWMSKVFKEYRLLRIIIKNSSMGHSRRRKI